MDEPVFWAFICFGIALILFVIEIIIPSGGLLGLMSGVSLIAGIVLLFIENKTLGIIGAAAGMVVVLVALGLTIRIFPNLPIVRMLTLRSPDSQTNDEDISHDHVQQQKNILVGHTGTALTDMRPVGNCEIDGIRVECLALGTTILRGAKIKVVSVDGIHTKVRAVE